MNVGLIDVDGHNFPNLALMKLSSYHKKQGDAVKLIKPIDSWFEKFDIVYCAKVFTFTQDVESVRADKIVFGGTGYNLENKLPIEIEKLCPDYTIYPELTKNTAYGFLTRGCPRNCPFCIVSQKEGLKSYQVAELGHFWNGQKEIKLLDPNLLACKNKSELMQQLVDSKAKIDFTQGLDIRLTDDKITHYIKKMNEQKQIKMLHFAYDGMQQSDLIENNLKEFKKATNIEFRKLRVYVLTNYNTAFEEDKYRVYKLKELGYDPYIMIYEKWRASRELKRFARWVNNKIIFRSCERFEDYRA